MSKQLKHLKAYLIDVLEAIERIEALTKDVTFEEFKKNTMAIRAVAEDFAVIGEAAKHISTENRGKFSLFPWKQGAGTHGKAIHDYDYAKVVVLWDAVRWDLPVLKSMIENFLDDFGKE
jgi:uncharacterized protein with HEPN domain